MLYLWKNLSGNRIDIIPACRCYSSSNCFGNFFYLKRGIYFEDTVKGWLNESIKNYRENHGSVWDIFQHKFGCCGIKSFTEWCNVTGLIPSLSRKPDFPYCDVLGEGTHVIFDAWCQTAVVSKIEEGLTGILYSCYFPVFCFFLEMARKQKRDN